MIYFDNSAISYPKPKSVMRASMEAFSRYSFNSGRGGYRQSIDTAEKIYSVRERIGRLLDASPERVVFTKNCTEALNIAIRGSVREGEHIVISSLEHNSVARVVHSLYEQGIADYDIVCYCENDDDTVAAFGNAMRDNTSLVVCTHSSNAFGLTLPIRRIGALCRERGIRFVVDAAQGAGAVNIRLKNDNIDILCAPGHKCLYSAMGIGFMALGDNASPKELMQGGTGSSSLLLSQPDYPPDRYESGTLNNIGIISLGAGIDYIEQMGMENIYNHEMALARGLYSALSHIGGVRLYTKPPALYKSMPIISFNVGDHPSEHIAQELARHDICVRAGLHCSPLAHKHFSTESTGTVRVSLGAFNTETECAKLINLVKKL